MRVLGQGTVLFGNASLPDFNFPAVNGPWGLVYTNGFGEGGFDEGGFGGCDVG